MKKGQKIAIVCGHFIPNLGYIEVYLAKQSARNQARVRVFTTSEIPPYVQNIANLSESVNEYEIERLPVIFSQGQMVWSTRLVARIQAFNPDVIVCIGVGKLFPFPVYQAFHKKIPVITLFGDNTDNYDVRSGGNTVKIKRTLLDTIKNRVYRKAIRYSDKLVGYTPETKEILQHRFPGLQAEINNKYQFVSLGYDAGIYFFDSALRQKKRAELHLPETTVTGITLTRLTPNKQIENIIRFIAWMPQNNRLRYFIIGAENTRYTREIERIIAEEHLENIVRLLPFVNDKHEINAWYNAADFGIWTQPAISIIEAMGSGLPVFLPRKKSMNHLLNNHNGLYYDQLDDTFALKLNDFLSGGLPREEIARKNQVFSYENIVKQMLEL